jgi:hypothetical protein
MYSQELVLLSLYELHNTTTTTEICSYVEFSQLSNT